MINLIHIFVISNTEGQILEYVDFYKYEPYEKVTKFICFLDPGS